MPKSLEIWMVTLPYAKFAIVVACGRSLRKGRVVLAPPIGKWLEGEDIHAVKRFVQLKGGTVEKVALDIAA